MCSTEWHERHSRSARSLALLAPVPLGYCQHAFCVLSINVVFHVMRTWQGRLDYRLQLTSAKLLTLTLPKKSVQARCVKMSGPADRADRPIAYLSSQE